MLNKRLKEISGRKMEIRSLLLNSETLNFEEIKSELEAIEIEERGINEKLEIASSLEEKVEVRQIEKIKENKIMTLSNEQIIASPEYRSAFLKRLQGKALNEVELRVATTATAAAAIPLLTQNMIIDKLRQVNVLFNRISVSQIPGAVKFVVANAKVAADWNTEGADGTPHDDTVAYVSLAGFELIKLAEISKACMAMDIDAFERYIVDEIGRQMAIAIENAILNGVGTTQPTGILPGVTFDATNQITIADFDDIDYDNIMDVLALLPTLYHPNAIFIMNRKTLFNNIRKIKDANGEPLFAYNAQDKAAMSLLGYPIVVDDYIADEKILLCDPKYYYLNISAGVELSVDDSIGFKSGKRTFRGMAVLDGKPALSEAFVLIKQTT